MAIQEETRPATQVEQRAGISRFHLVIFGFCTFMYWASLYVYVPILPVYAENLGASKTMVGLIIGSYGIAQLLGRIPLGVWSDRLGLRKPFLYGGLAMAGLGALWLGLASTPEGLFAARTLTGVGAAAWVAFTVLFSSYYATTGATRAISLISTVNGAAQMAATYAGGLMAQAYGWQSPFFAGMLIAMVGIAALPFVYEKPAVKKNSFSMQRLMRIGSVPLLLTVSGISALLQWASFVTTFGFVPVYASQQLGATRADLGLLTMVSLGAYTLTTLVTGMISNRLGYRTIIVTGILIIIAGTVIVPFIHSLPLLFVSQMVTNIGRALASPILMGLSILAVEPEDRATAMGFYQSIYSIGMTLGPIVTGILADQMGLPSVFYSAAAFCAVAAAISYIAIRNRVTAAA